MHNLGLHFTIHNLEDSKLGNIDTRKLVRKEKNEIKSRSENYRIAEWD